MAKKEKKPEFHLVETYKEFKERCNYKDPNHSIYYKFIKRPISYPLSWLVFKTNLRPNQLTLTGFIFAIISAALLSVGTYRLALLGVVVYFIYDIFDDFDGIIARLKNIRSRRGGWLDILAGYVGKLIVLAGVSIGVFNMTQNPNYLIYGIFAILGLSTISNIEHVTKIRFGVVQQQKLTYEEVKLDFSTLAGKLSVLAEIAGNIWFILFFLAGIFGFLNWFIIYSAVYFVLYSIFKFVYLNHKYKNV